MKCAVPALVGRVPLLRGGKTVSAHTLASLALAASRDACGRQLPGALMRRWSRGIYGSHGVNSPRGIASPVFRSCWRCVEAPVSARASLQGPLPTSTDTTHGVASLHNMSGLAGTAGAHRSTRRAARAGPLESSAESVVARGLAGGARRAPAGITRGYPGTCRPRVRPVGCRATGPAWVPAAIPIQLTPCATKYGTPRESWLADFRHLTK